jgi:CheY-like chemotaxis protein
VLIADDEPMLRSVIAEFISTLDGCTFAQAGDGVEAVEYLRKHRVDCLLSDARMPRMDLEELLDIVAKESPGTVVVATSGYSDLETACRILERGAHEFLAKPLNLDLLEQTLRWIPQRNRILRIAGEGSDGAQADCPGAFERLEEALGEADGLFAGPMRHARRTGGLAAILTQGDAGPEADELRLGALLHEIGSSSQHLSTAALERRLQAPELRFVRTQLGVGGRLIDRALPGRPTGEIVRRHLGWLDMDAREEGSWDRTQRLACALGAVNVVDALLQERPDRPAYSLEQGRTTLKRLHEETGLRVLDRLLLVWPEIERYYAAAPPR